MLTSNVRALLGSVISLFVLGYANASIKESNFWNELIEVFERNSLQEIVLVSDFHPAGGFKFLEEYFGYSLWVHTATASQSAGENDCLARLSLLGTYTSKYMETRNSTVTSPPPFLFLICQSAELTISQLKESSNKLMKWLEEAGMWNKIRIDSNVFLVAPKKTQGLQIWEIFQIKGRLFIEELTELKIWGTLLNKVWRRRNFHRADINATWTNHTDMKHVIQVDEKTKRPLAGASSSIFLDMEQFYNFTVQFIKYDIDNVTRAQTVEGGFFRISKNIVEGEDTMKQLTSGQSDIFIMQPTQVPYRAKIFNFLQPISALESIAAMFRQPPSREVRDIFTAPFDFRSWICCLSLWIVAYFILTFVTKVKTVCRDFVEDDKRFSEDISTWMVSIAVQQGWESYPESPSLRVIFFIGSFTGFILYNAYSAAIVFTLLNEGLPITDLDSLMASRLNILADGVSSSMANIDILKDLEKKYNRKGRWETDVKRAMQSVWNGSATYISYGGRGNIQKILNQTHGDICDRIFLVKAGKSPYRNGMMTSKLSPFRKFFNYITIRLFEIGLHRRYYRQLYDSAANVRCLPVDKQYREFLGFRDVFTSFAILASGFICSLVMLGLEVVYRRINPVAFEIVP